MSVRIVLVDDHRLLRDGLRMILEKELDFVVVAEAADIRSALACVGQQQPDLVVLDVHLPDGSGVEAARQILASWPQI